MAGFGAGALFFAGPASVLLLPPAEADPMGLSQILLVGLGISKGPGSASAGRRSSSFTVWSPERPSSSEPRCCETHRKGGSLRLGREPDVARIQQEVEWHEMLNRPLACMLWLTFIFGATSGLLAIGQWKPMMGSILAGTSFAPEWMGGFGRFVEPVGILAIFNAIGRIFWGRVSDYIDRPRAMMLMYLGQGLAFMMLAGIHSHLAVFIASAWVGLNFGGNFALFPSATADYFGTKNLGMNYGSSSLPMVSREFWDRRWVAFFSMRRMNTSSPLCSPARCVSWQPPVQLLSGLCPGAQRNLRPPMLEPLLRPDSVAVVGASRTPGKVGHAVVSNLLEGGFEGAIYPINPQTEEILGLSCYADLSAVRKPIDLCVVAVPPARVKQAVEEALACRVRVLAVLTAGFKEVGEEGAALEREIAELCQRRKVPLMGPNCLGLINAHHNLNATFAPVMPPPGGISVISQSGALCVAILDSAASEGLGLATTVSLGNKADLDEVDFLQALAEDPDTRVVAAISRASTMAKNS